MKKKYMMIMLALILALAFAACGDADDPVTESVDPPQYEAETYAPDPPSNPLDGAAVTNEGDDPAPAETGDDWWVLEPAQDMYISIYQFFDGVAVANYASSGHGGSAPNQNTYTAIDIYGNELFAPTDKYFHIGPFKNGVAVVDARASYDDEGIYGLIDLSGKEIVAPGKYTRFVTGGSGEVVDRAIVVQDDNWGYGVIDLTGAEIVPIGTYDWISEFNYGAAVVTDANNNNNRGAIDITGKLIIPLGEYVYFYGFYDGVTVVYTSDNVSWGIIDATGEMVMPLRDRIYDEIGAFSDGVAVVRKYDGGGIGVIDKTGAEIIPLSAEYATIRDFTDGVAVARDSNEQWGVIDKSGNVVVPFGKYDQINMFADGLALAYDYTENVTAVIDTAGNEIVPMGKYGNAYLNFTNGYATYQISDYDGGEAYNMVLDRTGREVYLRSFREMHIYDNITPEGIAVASKDQRVGLLDLNKWAAAHQ